eukprot:4518538-Pleurochrysis_carterae.AAC.2
MALRSSRLLPHGLSLPLRAKVAVHGALESAVRLEACAAAFEAMVRCGELYGFRFRRASTAPLWREARFRYAASASSYGHSAMQIKHAKAE